MMAMEAATGKVASSTIAVVMMLVVGGMIYSQSAAQPAKPVCVSDEDRVHIRAQVLGAVDEAFRDNVKHLFAGWLKDPHLQPERAAAGLQSSVVAYQRARADALKWSPASC
jgi:hypothetical protein